MVVSKDAECTDIVQEYEFNNLITDNGLELIGRTTAASFTVGGGPCNRFCVGSGTATPSVDDTTLQTLVATASAAPTLGSMTSSYSAGYLEAVYYYQFPQGAAAGNLSEIGIGASATDLFSRARILDASGNPTTITVLSNEFLTVYYTLRCSIPQSDIVYTFDAVIDGTPTSVECVIRPANANTSSTLGWQMRTGSSTTSPSVHVGAISTPISLPSGVNLGVPLPVALPYVAGSRQRLATISLSISDGNLSGGLIRSLVHAFGPGRWQMEFTPVLPKDNTKTIVFTIGYSWGRE